MIPFQCSRLFEKRAGVVAHPPDLSQAALYCASGSRLPENGRVLLWPTNGRLVNGLGEIYGSVSHSFFLFCYYQIVYGYRVIREHPFRIQIHSASNQIDQRIDGILQR
jgi:hypothetical protein